MLRNLQNQSYRKPSERGFSMVEMTVVVAIVFLLIAIALVNIVPSLHGSKANAGMEMVLGELRRTSH
jgi:type II secretory pathway pseudopilin PulG